MATTTQPTPNFDITAADDMDLHSDDGALGYNDGDIELDLEPPPAFGPDDDVSIDDAASASGVDAQAAPGGDNDDYMVDQEDVIEEDYSYQDQDVDVDVDVDAVAEQSVATDTIATQAEADIQDEDLLDYSEEDEDYHNTALRSPWLQPDSMQDASDKIHDAPIQQDESFETQSVPIQQDESLQAQDAPIQQDEIPADLQALMSTTSKTSQSPRAHPDVIADRALEADNHENSLRAQSASSTQEDVQNDGDGGGVMLKDQEEYANAETDHNDMAPPGHDHDESAHDGEHQEDTSFQLTPVTVNCMSEELWLFKQHDYENSGDWLLDDVSVAKRSMSDLFQACRSALGDEVLNGMEIGFRFDHFRNMELFEENTASVAISLERLVGYYRVLHEQDGNNDPDSFYMTLMYRPRFATLLADIARYAENGRGYSGLEAAIAAGETNFHSASLDLPAEETTEWDTEGQEQEQHEQEHEQEQPCVDDGEHEHERDVNEQPQEEDANEQTYEENSNDAKHVENADEQNNNEAQVPQDVDAQVHAGDQLDPDDQENQDEHNYEEAEPYQDLEQQRGHEEDDTQDSHEEGGIEVHESEETAAENVSTEGHEEDKDQGHMPQPRSSSEVSTNPQRVESYAEQGRSQSNDQTAAELEARRLQEEGDIIDYSDGEDEESATIEEVEQAPHTESAPSPTTVQGDESTNAERQSPNTGSPSIGRQTDGDDGQASFDTAEDPDADAEHDVESDANDGEYWQYVEAFEEGDTPDESPSDEVQKDAADLEYDGDANQDYGNYEYQDLEQQAELEFTNGEDFNGDENSATDGDYFAGTNDVLDPDNAQWTAAQEATEETTAYEVDQVDAQDEEDSVAGQAASATSSAADPTTASSTDTHDVSPQGHKRSIDEAGHGVDIAPDSIDAKRARV